MLEQAYPYLERNTHLKPKVHARIKFAAWMTLKGHEHVLTAYHALLADPQAIDLLGFDTLPAYDTLRECLNDRLTPTIKAQLMHALLAEQKRLLDTLGDQQAQDTTPVHAPRWEDDCPYNGYREVEMHRCELRWDPTHEALLTQQFYHGTCKEDRWILPFNTRLDQVGIQHATLTVDGGYTALHLIAKSWEQGTLLRFKAKAHWDLDLETARKDMEKRYNKHWRHEAYLKGADLEQKATFLVRHGTDNDTKAVGKWLRNRQIEELSEAEETARRWIRSRNEGLHRPLKRLPFEASWKGQARMLARVQAVCLTVHLVQLTRLQNGVTHGLARTAHIL